MCLATALWARQEAEYFFISTKSATGEWKDISFKKKDVAGRKVDEYIRENADKDIYFCPFGFNHARRTKENAVFTKMLWSDMDFVDPRTCKIKPTIVWETSPGKYHGLWLTDKVVTLELNKRLSYFLGCDKKGWDATQVLRIPGTRNYKYPSTPKVRLLWDDGPTYKVLDLKKQLPTVEMNEREEVELPERLPDILDIKLSPPVKRALQDCRMMTDASDRLYYVACAMIKDGSYDIGEIATVLMQKGHKVSEHLWKPEQSRTPRKATARAIGQAIADVSAKEGPVELNGYRLFVPMSEIEEADIDWLWYPYLARRKITILEGDPSGGKSYLIEMVGKAFCDGIRLPRGGTPVNCDFKRIQGHVFFADTENDAATDAKKRLRWNGIQHMERFHQSEVSFSIDDTKEWNKLLEEIETIRPIMVVFDTINLYIGGADIHRANEATQALAPFDEIAKRYDCCVVLIRHLTKAGKKDSTNPLYRGLGSIALGGKARIVMTCGRSPDDPNVRVMTVTKTNDMYPKGLEFEITHAPTLKEPFRSQFSWGDWVDLTSYDVLNTPDGMKVGKTLDQAISLIKEALSKEGIELPKLEQMAETRNISRRTLYRAGKQLGVVTERQKGPNQRDRTAIWSLPKD
jgi:hypothetical protein